MCQSNLVNRWITVGANSTTNTEQIEAIELEGYGRPTCNVRPATTRRPS